MNMSCNSLAQDFTLRVTITRYKEWQIRLWIARQLIKLACWISWLNVEFKEQ